MIATLRPLLIAAVLASGLTAGPASADEATFTKRTWPPEGGTGTRDYWVYVPGPSDVARPLVVFLHGCLQTALQAAEATRFNQLADQRDFVVVYPQQNVTPGSSAPLAEGNGSGCWNWFLPDHQARGQGEPRTIAGIVQAVTQDENIDPDRVYIEGISAGADMTVNVVAAYPELFAAAGAVAGCAYATCSDVTGALAHTQMAERARVVPMFAVQGTADTLNNYAMGETLVRGWLGTQDLSDDGIANASIPRAPADVEHHDFEQTPEPGSGDPCIRSNNWPCPGGVLGLDTYPYTVEQYVDAAGCGVLDFWSIHGLEHAYPNASETVFTDQLGPDITTAAYDFFEAHARGACAPV